MGRGEFKVTISNLEVVAAALPLQEYWLPLSNLDLLLPPLDVGVFFCYKNKQSMSFGSMVGVLKKAMAQALVTFYAFSGEVVPNSDGEPEILCNNRGVDFTESFADIELKELNFYDPDQSVEGKLVPKKKHGVLAVQVTELNCGGVVVACTFDHRIADAYSTNMFLVSWAEMAQSKSLTIQPTFRRSLLNPRRPGHIDPSLNDMYVPVTALPPPSKGCTTDDHDHDHLISRIYYITSEQLENLQALATSNGYKRTKLESFCAFLWKMVAKSDTSNDRAQKLCKMGIVVDGRTRLSEGNYQNDHSNLMAAYFGNVLSIPFGGENIEDLTGKPLSWVAEEVHDFLECAVTKEHFLGLIDWVESHRPVPGLTKIYGSNEGPAFVVSSGQRFPSSKVDFGWGSPVFGSYHFPWGGSAGYVMPMPSPVGNGDWIVYMHMMKGQMELMEKEAAHVLRPLTFNYLNGVNLDISSSVA